MHRAHARPDHAGQARTAVDRAVHVVEGPQQSPPRVLGERRVLVHAVADRGMRDL